MMKRLIQQINKTETKTVNIQIVIIFKFQTPSLGLAQTLHRLIPTKLRLHVSVGVWISYCNQPRLKCITS